MFSRIPLAWYNLSYRPVRFAVFLAGIGFAVVLMFVQLGFWGALLDSFTAIIKQMNADLVIINQAKYSLVFTEPFPRPWLIEARSVKGVTDVKPLYLRVGSWKKPGMDADGCNSPRLLIRVIAYDLRSPVLRIPELESALEQVRISGTALADRSSKPVYNLRQPPPRAELNRRKIEIVGQFNLGTDFVNDANLIMTEQNFASYFGGGSSQPSPLEEVDVGLIFLDQGANPAQVQQDLRRKLSAEVKVLTRAELVTLEEHYWQNSMPVGFVFLMGLVVGFVVGVIICSQILSSDVADHLAEYATLKAIGYSNAYLSRVIVAEALLLSVLAFIPGTLASWLIFDVLSAMTGLPLRLTLVRAAIVLFATMVMCVLSGFLAARKVWVADPAEVFG